MCLVGVILPPVFHPNTSHMTTQPNWLNTRDYPFDHHYMTMPAGRMHYLDEGQGDQVLLFVHGTPTWSFLYRDVIRAFAKKYRCVAIDHLGFGLSDVSKTTFDGTPASHAQNLKQLIEWLDLRNITLIVHDFGGPIGLAAALDISDRIDRVVLFNSWLWATEDTPEVQKIDKLVRSWLGRFLYLRLNISPKYLLKQGFSDKTLLPKGIHRQYIKPFPTRASRRPLLQIAEALAGSSDWYQEQWERLNTLAGKEWLILWGTKDRFITPAFLEKWQDQLPDAQVQRFDCGHFVMEERTEEVIERIGRFLGRE